MVAFGDVGRSLLSLDRHAMATTGPTPACPPVSGDVVREKVCRVPNSTDSESSSDVDPLEAVQRLVAEAGAHARPLREVIALLTNAPRTLEELVRATGVSRRGVEAVLSALGVDVVEDHGTLVVRADRVGAYRDRFGYEQLTRVRLADPLGPLVEKHAGLVGEMDRVITAAPVSRRALDHVSATAETVVRRALWLDATFDLAGAHLLCVGDHDLTSLAVAQVNPAVTVTVVDLDERILGFIDEEARRRGVEVRCLFTDLRFGLPASASRWADLLITDPPYTAEGVQLFLARGLAGLRDRERGRVVMAYGFGESQPGLGLKVQRAVQDLHLVFEAILPDFNRYVGAQAVGSASDLYVCRPTASTWKALDNPERSGLSANIYTHGPQSLEASGSGAEQAVIDALCTAASDDGRVPIAAAVADAWTPRAKGIAHVRLGTVFSGGLPPVVTRRRECAVAVDLSADPGPWLLRMLLAADAHRLAVLVSNDHADLGSETSQRALISVVERKYTLRFRRSSPDSRYALVEADSVGVSDDPAVGLVRRILDRAHGKIGNLWREGLIRAVRNVSGETLTKNQARSRIQDTARRLDLLDLTLVEVPRPLLAPLLEDVAASVADLPAP